MYVLKKKKSTLQYYEVSNVHLEVRSTVTLRNTVYMFVVNPPPHTPTFSPKTLLPPTFTMGSHYVIDVPRSSLFFATLMHACVNHCECKPQNKKWGRPP